MNIGIDLSTIYVTACGQVMPSYASGRKHEAECQACQCAIAGESEPDENDDEPDEPDENETPDDDAECDDPVCPTCQERKIRMDEESGEMVLIESEESAPVATPLCEKCETRPATEPHTCPFEREIDDDNAMCTCCEECEDECAGDI